MDACCIEKSSAIKRLQEHQGKTLRLVLFANAAMFVVESSTSIKAVLPQGAAGSAAVKVVKGTVESAPFAYTRDV